MYTYVYRMSVYLFVKVNVWDYAMDVSEVQNIAASCSNSGNAMSWAQLSTGIEGTVVMQRDSPICRSKLHIGLGYMSHNGILIVGLESAWNYYIVGADQNILWNMKVSYLICHV